MIYTYDEKEAKLFGFSYYPTVYSMVDVGDVEMIKRKCFFVGVAKDRLEKLIRIYDKLELCGCNPIFYISGVPRKKQKEGRELFIILGCHINQC